MKLFLDENIPRSIASELIALGFEAEHVVEVGLRGATDREIAIYAKKQKAILVTKDLEFGSLITYPPGTHYSLIVLRLSPNAGTAEISRTLKEFLTTIKIQNLPGKMYVLELGHYRVRELQ